jgi:hypothetical protein
MQVNYDTEKSGKKAFWIVLEDAVTRLSGTRASARGVAIEAKCLVSLSDSSFFMAFAQPTEKQKDVIALKSCTGIAARCEEAYVCLIQS